MNTISNINKFKRYNVRDLNFVRKNNLDNLIEILSTSIDGENKLLLVNLINNWDFHHMNISIENDHNYIINNSNQLNHINVLIEEAKYIVAHNTE